MSYVESIATQQIATACVFCSRPLVDADSVERGCGPDCADKYGRDDDPGPINELKIAAGLDAAPEPMQTDLRKHVDQGDLQRAVQRAIWHAAVAAEYGGPGAREAIAAAHTVAQGAGYYRTANQIAKMHIARAGIKLVRLDGKRVAVVTPYNPAFVAAIKNVPGRQFTRVPEAAWIVPEARLPEAINALAVGFPGYMAFGTDDNLFAIPLQPVALPPPVTQPAGAPEFETQETGPKRPKILSDLKKGDIVVDPRGHQREVGWIGEKGGDPRVGLRIEGQRGYEFFSYSEVNYLPEKSLAALERGEKAEHAADARAAGATPEPELPKVERQIPAEMYPFQIDGVRWMDAVGSGILADDMGLGKTLQSIIVLDAPALVVCPATLRVNWAREVGRWRPELSTQILQGTKPVPPGDMQADVVIVNYDIVSKHYPSLSQRKWNTLVVDEAQAIKTLRMKKDRKTHDVTYEGSARAVTVAQLGRAARRRLLLTGTPILNRTCELWPLLHVVNPSVWGNFFQFAQRYCAAFKGRFGWDFSGSSNEEELHEKLAGKLMLRRMKTEVMKDFPEKSRESISVPLSDAAAEIYHRAAKAFLDWVKGEGALEADDQPTLRLGARGEAVLELQSLLGMDAKRLDARGLFDEQTERKVMELQAAQRLPVDGVVAGSTWSVLLADAAFKRAKRAETLTKMTALRRLAAEGKVEAALEWIQTHHESTGRPLVVMGHHASALDPLVAACREAKLRTGTILGSDAQAVRQKHIDAFQAGELDVIVCSIMAAGVGITLTAAQEMLFIERMWRPSDLVQAEDREWRIGQKNAVQITYMDGAGTIDAAIATLLKDKVSTIAAVIDGKALSEEEAMAEVMGTLFRQLQANPRGTQGEIWPAFNWVDPADG
jgi:SWI/SNF-related matrix-associated actin-dependent regulator of chromatin subfamily A-like protein 1